MFIVDTNVLVYAADSGVAEHARCRALVEQWRRRHSAWFLTRGIAYQFLRIVTHPRVMRQPWTMAAGVGFLGALQDSPGLTFLAPTSRHAAAL